MFGLRYRVYMPLNKEQMREYMRKRRARRDELEEDVICGVVGNPESAVDTATTEETGEVTPEAVVEVPRTRTDRLFENDRPNYYIFKQDAVERACWACGGAFKTRMELNKFCGPKCKNSWLTSAFGKLKASKPEDAAI